MKYFVLLSVLCILVSCSVKRGENQYNFMQAQIKTGHTTIETESGVGGRAQTASQGGPLDLWLGLVKRTFTLLPPMKCVEFYENEKLVRKECSTLPPVDIDTSVKFNPVMPEISDTVATGESAENLREENVGGEVK
jgi:hypothetical protein